MHDAISFGAVWTVWFRGWHPSFSTRSETRHLRTDPADYRYHFGMTKELFATEIPAQISWANADADSWVFDADSVVPEALDDGVLSKWIEFHDDLLIPAVDDGRVTWNVCGLRSGCKSYYDYAQSLLKQGRTVANYL